ncbi:MAG: GNAT family N-acetyltransferase [Desulfobacterales bacterium]|nr:GNAT family N-acetyltransferase [Desulfobacterales bacterium]
MSTYHISLMQHDDIDESVKVLSTAMLHNPLHIAVFKGSGEFERLKIESTFKDLFMTLPGIVFVVKANTEIVGVMRMKSAIGKDQNFKPVQPINENDITWRKAFWLNEWAQRRPEKQHWHLGPIGVLPSYRKLGIGSQLMQRFCDEVDNCFAKAYLETDLDENVRFYEKFGFKTTSKSMIFEVENKYMVRPAKKG